MQHVLRNVSVRRPLRLASRSRGRLVVDAARVAGQVAALAEAQRAEGAAEGALARVRPGVPLQQEAPLGSAEQPLAHRALKGRLGGERPGQGGGGGGVAEGGRSQRRAQSRGQGRLSPRREQDIGPQAAEGRPLEDSKISITIQEGCGGGTHRIDNTGRQSTFRASLAFVNSWRGERSST